MNEKLKEILALQKNGKYIYTAREVSEFHRVSLNAVYSSRKKTDKLDKLMIFDKIASMIEEDEKNTVAITGDKKGVLNGLENILQEDKKYKILYKEI